MIIILISSAYLFILKKDTAASWRNYSFVILYALPLTNLIK
nr:MAG TPA: hypothetical protein [Caudoviricetes sp.]